MAEDRLGAEDALDILIEAVKRLVISAVKSHNDVPPVDLCSAILQVQEIIGAWESPVDGNLAHLVAAEPDGTVH